MKQNAKSNSSFVEYADVLKNPEQYLNKMITIKNINVSDCEWEDLQNTDKKIKNGTYSFIFRPYLYDNNKSKILFWTKRLKGRNKPDANTIQRGVLKHHSNEKGVYYVGKYCDVKVDDTSYVFEDFNFSQVTTKDNEFLDKIENIGVPRKWWQTYDRLLLWVVVPIFLVILVLSYWPRRNKK
ncbi:hypothetical protein [Flavobacterium facile]|uniref:hypothetical protein n=1 Tax=Flavobacterium facile TaxID=2893174 RepID=UPI002E78A25B|nr:hypothetical protein [Flavobacterium sp. T-12]